MRFRLVAAALILALGPAAAQNGGNGKPNSVYATPLGYCQFTAQSSAQLLSAVTPTSTTTCTPPARATWAQITVETAGVRWRDDGTAPTASIGMPIAAGGVFTYNGNMGAIQFIAQSGSPVVDISFYDAPGVP